MTARDTVTLAVEDELTRLGWSRAQMARALGVGASALGKKLNGRLDWSMRDLDRLSNALGRQPAWFLMARSAVTELVTPGYAALRRVTRRALAGLLTPHPMIVWAG